MAQDLTEQKYTSWKGDAAGEKKTLDHLGRGRREDLVFCGKRKENQSDRG